MVVPQFLRFYQGYTATTLLDEYAITFFSLVNAMYRVQAMEALDQVHIISIPNMEKSDSQKSIELLRKNAVGIHGIIQEVKTIKANKKWATK